MDSETTFTQSTSGGGALIDDEQAQNKQGKTKTRGSCFARFSQRHFFPDQKQTSVHALKSRAVTPSKTPRNPAEAAFNTLPGFEILFFGETRHLWLFFFDVFFLFPRSTLFTRLGASFGTLYYKRTVRDAVGCSDNARNINVLLFSLSCFFLTKVFLFFSFVTG